MEQKISYDRAIEIATMALHKLKENDADLAQTFFQEEIDMNEEETKFFGVDRIRRATNITWSDNEGWGKEVPLKSEADIPWDVLDDDIQYYLEETFNHDVEDFDVEEDNL